MTVPFIPTQRVVCRRELPYWGGHGDVVPRCGGIYTVRGIVRGVDARGRSKAVICLKLDEIVNPAVRIGDAHGEPVWEADCFEAVNEGRLDIFRRMLVEPPQPWGRG